MRSRSFRPSLALGSAALATAALSSCQTQQTAAPVVNNNALSKMEHIMKSANACWFKSGDAAFKSYQLAPELNSFTGRPRILIVERKNPGGRPLLVVQAEGTPARTDAFGPLMSGAEGARISKDVTRWSGGESGC